MVTLPEKWCIKATRETYSRINKYASDRLNRPVTDILRGCYYHFPEFGHMKCTAQNKRDGYEEITFDQFEKYVLQEGDPGLWVRLRDGKKVRLGDALVMNGTNESRLAGWLLKEEYNTDERRNRILTIVRELLESNKRIEFTGSSFLDYETREQLFTVDEKEKIYVPVKSPLVSQLEAYGILQKCFIQAYESELTQVHFGEATVFVRRGQETANITLNGKSQGYVKKSMLEEIIEYVNKIQEMKVLGHNIQMRDLRFKVGCQEDTFEKIEQIYKAF